MPRFARAAVLAAALFAAIAPSASAHQGDPNYRSVLRGGPPAPGVHVQVLGYDNELELVNSSSQPVVVYGYNGEPYARVLADGTVEVNQKSPALYLNEDRFGTTPVPPSADFRAAPQWKVQDKAGRFVWHDHRMHYMAHGVPPQVKDKAKKTKITDYTIPLEIGAKHTSLHGTLFWNGTGGGFPVAATASLAVLVLLAVLTVVLVRRRRRGPGPGTSARPAEEAW